MLIVRRILDHMLLEKGGRMHTEFYRPQAWPDANWQRASRPSGLVHDLFHLMVTGAVDEKTAEILTPKALLFLEELELEFGERRNALLRSRRERAERISSKKELPDFLQETAAIRAADWQVAPAPEDLDDRRVEITGPTDAKMMINALNSGANVFMADLEDSLSPTWRNVIEGQ